LLYEASGSSSTSSSEEEAALLGEEPQNKSARSRKRSGTAGAPKRARTSQQIAAQDPTPESALASLKSSKHAASAQHMVVSLCGLRVHCQLCGTDIGTRSNVWNDHCNSKKHTSRLNGGNKKSGAGLCTKLRSQPCLPVERSSLGALWLRRRSACTGRVLLRHCLLAMLL